MAAKPGPFGKLAYLYVGTKDVEASLRYWTEVIGAPRAWDFTAFGTRVAAVAPGEGPLLLLAGHREPGTSIAIYSVDDLEKTAKALRKKGWKATGDAFGIPDGPAYRFDDPSGNPFAFFEPQRPHAMTREFEEEMTSARERRTKKSS